MKVKKVPMRQCIGCREMKPKKELVRVVRSQEGVVAFDKTGRAAGRGAYICLNKDCLQKAKKTRAFDRALEHAIPPEVYEQLELDLERRDLV